MKTLYTLFLLILSINIAHAEDESKPALIEYDVDIIIFEDAHARYINSEYWHEDTTQNDSLSEVNTGPNSNSTSNSAFKKQHFRTTKPTILNNEYKRVNNSSEYNVLFYGSWRQTGLDENRTFDININELNNTHVSSSENYITGNFKLVLGRYLHIYADLEYHRDQKPAVTENSALDTGSLENNPTLEQAPFPINIHRRMRSKELHYIDHPLVGMLIQINPVKNSTE